MTSGIYCYINKDTNQVIYVGKDSYIHYSIAHKRHLSASQYKSQKINQVLQNTPQKYQYKILKQGNFSDALLSALEVIYIKRYGTYENRKGHGKSYGFNFTIGGDGTRGWHHAVKTKQKIRESQLGEKSSNYGKHLSEEHKKKISIGNKGQKRPNGAYDKSFNEKITRSKAMTSTGFFRVSKERDPTTKNGFIWRYFYENKNTPRKKIRRVNLSKLKEAVLQKDLEWQVVDEEKAKQTCKKYGYNYEDLK